MSTKETRDSEIRGAKKLQADQGGIKPSDLKDGDTVFIETKEFAYQIRVLETNVGLRYIVDTASTLFDKKGICTGIDSHIIALKLKLEDWIGLNVNTIFTFHDGKRILIGQTKGASILSTTKDGKKFAYDLWPK